VNWYLGVRKACRLKWKEKEELTKVQRQNDGLQAGIAILANKSSDILTDSEIVLSQFSMIKEK
jgi:hypothetical protein